MQINSTTSFTPQAPASLSVDSKLSISQQRDRLAVQQEKTQSQEQNKQSQKSNRFDVDLSALALVEQTASSSSKGAGYDQPSSQNRTAVSAYEQVDNLAQRENVQQLFGVDLFA
jgi:hypothetical protein